MNGLVFVFLLLAAICLFIMIQLQQDYDSPTLWVVLVLACISAAYFAWDTPESLAREAETKEKERQQRIAEVTPRRISEADGCTVYAFKPSDRWLYFTKCANAETTTSNAYSVPSGKTTRTETMEIKTK